MKEFKSREEFNVIGRGKVLIILSDRDRESSKDTNDLLGQVVKIDNTQYLITGIECQGYRGWRLNDPIACLVRKPTEEEKSKLNNMKEKVQKLQNEINSLIYEFRKENSGMYVANFEPVYEYPKNGSIRTMFYKIDVRFDKRYCDE
jgi:hypothetical protein